MKRKVKKKKISNFPNIRTVLRQELKNFATKDDFSNFKLDILADINRGELKAIDREQNYHSDVMTQFDKVMKKLETMRQESTLGESQQDQKLEDHEDRIKVLESSQKS